MHPNVRVTNLKGEKGGLLIADTSAHAGDFDAIQALEATVVASMTSSTLSGTLTSVPIPAGATIFARISSITLTSGKVIAYNSERN